MPAEQSSNGYLFDLYRQYIGEPENRTDVYLGFGLFLGGTALGAVALCLFLWSSQFSRSDAAYFTWVQPAYAMGMLSLPALILGIVVLLPTERKTDIVSAAGAAITALATGGFLMAYPEHWNFMGEVDYTVEVTATYAVGLAGLTASTGAALIAHYLELAREVERVRPDAEADDEAGESYSDEEIRQDIDEAMEDVELSWGGVEQTEHTRLQFSGDEFDDVDVDTTLGTKTIRSSGVDAQVAGLKGLKGGDTKTTTSSETVDDQTQKLRELREKQRAQANATEAKQDGVVASVLDRVRSLFGRR